MAHIDFVTPTGNRIGLSVVNSGNQYGLCVHVNGDMVCGAYDQSRPVMRHSDEAGYRIAFWDCDTLGLDFGMPEIAIPDEATARQIRQIVHGYTPSFEEFWDDNAGTIANRVALYESV